MRIGAGLVMAGAIGTLLSGRPACEAAALGASADEGPGVDAQRSAFVGRWTLDAESSEDALEKMREAGSWRRAAGGLGGGGRPGGPGGWDRTPGRHRGDDDPETAMEDRNQVRLFPFLSASELTVSAVAPDVAMVAQPGGFERTLRPDGGQHETEAGGEVKAHWDKARLVVQTKAERGEVKETWTVSGDGRLTIEMKVDRPSGPSVRVRRVFVRAGQPPAGPAGLKD